VAKLNDELLREAEPILERYREMLLKTRAFQAHSLEHELRALWSVGYQGLKPLIYTMAQHGRYQEVAAYYMEHSNGVGVVSEFKPHLAALYGVKWYHAPDCTQKRRAFWSRVFDDDETP
jgi:hypothetical protein